MPILSDYPKRRSGNRERKTSRHESACGGLPQPDITMAAIHSLRSLKRTPSCVDDISDGPSCGTELELIDLNKKAVQLRAAVPKA